MFCSGHWTDKGQCFVHRTFTLVMKAKATLFTFQEELSPEGSKNKLVLSLQENGEILLQLSHYQRRWKRLATDVYFPRVRHKDHFLNFARNGSAGVASKTGWTNKNILPQDLEHVLNILAVQATVPFC